MNELKCCPFCGGEVVIALKGNKEEQWFVTRGVGNNKCTCRVFMESNLFLTDDPETIKCEEKDKLIAKWNTRKPMDNIVKKLEENSQYCVPLGGQSFTGIKLETAINIVKQEINNGLE